MIRKQIIRLNVFLIICMVCTLFTSCGETAPEVTNTITDTNSTIEKAEPTSESRTYPTLPDATYDGSEFTFLTLYVGTGADWIDWHPRDIYSENMNAELINDAVYLRNAAIEDKYDIRIKEIRFAEDKFTTALKNAVNAADDIYDVVVPRIKNSISLAQEGMFVNLFDVPHMDLSNPWWNQSAVNQLSVGGNLYIVDSDLLVIGNDSVEAFLFNKELIENYELENPYRLVNEGKWTFDKLREMSKAISEDLNGDGEMYIKDDKFGLVLQRDSVLSLFNASGGSIIEKDSDDYPIITFPSEKNYSLLEKITELMRDKEHVVDLHRYNGQFGIYDEQAKMFSENRALMTWVRMRIVENLRNMEADFGILPLPKYDEKQTNYISRINSHVPTGLAVLTSNQNLERTGVILEALSAESKYTLQPAYYELNLKTKIARDAESEEMLDIIFDSNHMYYDLSEIYQFGNFADTIFRIPTDDKPATYASIFESKEGAMQNAIDKVIEKYESAAQ